MRTLRSIVGLLVFLLTFGMLTAPPASAALAVQAVAADVQLFYYPWYGTPSVNGNYRHWQQGGHTPPDDVGADFYPALGPYDSGDIAVIDQHMRWIQQSGAGTIISSWWGQGSYEDRVTPAILAS